MRPAIFNSGGGGSGATTITGTLTAPRIPFASAPQTLADDGSFYWDQATTTVVMNTLQLGAGVGTGGGQYGFSRSGTTMLGQVQGLARIRANSADVQFDAAIRSTFDAGADLGSNSLRWARLYCRHIKRYQRTITGAATLSEFADNDIFCNSASPFTVTLPSAVSAVSNGVSDNYRIKNLGAGTITVAATAGAVEVTTILTGQVFDYVSNGADWKVF